MIPNDQGFLRLWGNGSKKTQNSTITSPSNSAHQQGAIDNSDAVDQDKVKSVPGATTIDNQEHTKGSLLPATLHGCNSTDLSIAQTQDDLYAAHRDAYENETTFTSHGFLSPPDPFRSAFGEAWRESLRELSAASRDLDDARDDFSRSSASRKERILNAINETREECHTLTKVMKFDYFVARIRKFYPSLQRMRGTGTARSRFSISSEQAMIPLERCPGLKT